MTDSYDPAKFVYPVKIRHYNMATSGWSKSFSYFPADSCNGQSAVGVLKSVVAATVQANAGKSSRPRFAFGVAVGERGPATAPVSTRFEFYSCLRCSFEAAH